MYVDDSHLTYAGNNADDIQSSLKQDLAENVHDWLRANKLTLNMTKTEFMLPVEAEAIEYSRRFIDTLNQ